MQIIKQFFSFIVFILGVIVPERPMAQAPDWQWAKSVGGIGFDNCSSIIVDQVNGDVYSTGYFVGTKDFDPGPGTFILTSAGDRDIYICKLDSSGNFIWAKAMGGPGYEQAFSIVLDPARSGDIYTTGGFYGTSDFDPGPETFNLTSAGFADIFISKLDALGNFVWAVAMGGFPDGGVGMSIAIDPINGDVYTTGNFYGTVDFDPAAGTYNLTSAGAADIFISKLNNSGNFVWAKAMGEVNYDIGKSIAIDPINGDVYTTGYFWETVDFDPGAGTYNLTSAGAYDIFISKLDDSGNFVWAKAMGGPSDDQANSIAIDPISRDVYTIGEFWGIADFDPGAGTYNLTSAGASDIFISKLDDFGNFLWAKAMGGLGHDIGSSIVINPINGDVNSTGYFNYIADFDPNEDTFNLTPVGNADLDIFISKLNSSGNFLWAEAAGGTRWEVSNSIALDNFGNIYVAGDFASPTISFGPIILTNEDTAAYYDEGFPYYVSDIFIAKLDHCSSNVTSTDDSGPGSLRDIISCLSSGATITFSLPPMSQITLTSGEIVIDKNLTLSGPGVNNLTLSGDNTSRIFNLLSGKNFTIKNLSLKNATSVINGGAIYVKGNLTLENTLLQNNFQNGMHKCMTLINPGNLTVVGNVEIKN